MGTMGKAESTKFLYEKRILQRLCFKCGNNPIDVPFSKNRCRVCLDKGLSHYRKRKKRKKSLMSAYYQKLKISHICFLCRYPKEPHRKENVHCTECAMFLSFYREMRIRLRKEIADDQVYKLALKQELQKLKLKYPTRRMK